MAVQNQQTSTATTAPATERFFSEADMRLLTAICDTLMPGVKEPDDAHGYFALAASDQGVPQAVADTLASLPSDTDRAETRLLFRLLASPALGLLLAGQPRSFLALGQPARERFLRAMANSRLPQLRSGFQVLKRLTLVYFHCLTDARGRNPTWPALGYSGPISPPPDVAKPIVPLDLQRDTTLDCDVVVIGSGAGGGVVAGELAAAGKSVIVLEQGAYYNEADYNQQELDMLGRLWAEPYGDFHLPPDGELPDGRRPAHRRDRRREPGVRGARAVCDRRQRLPDIIWCQPDADDHGDRTPRGAGD